MSPAVGTAADWLPGIRDAHDDEDAGGWQAAWLDRPTWDPTIAPNIKGRTGGKGRRSAAGAVLRTCAAARWRRCEARPSRAARGPV